MSERMEPGLDDAEIDRIAAPLGFRVPEEVRRVFRWHRGSSLAPFLPPNLKSTVPALLTLELLERLDRTLGGLGSTIVDHWQPGLSREQMDALTDPYGFRLPDEAALWWGRHNGADTAELMPSRRPMMLESAMRGFEIREGAMSDAFGLTRMVPIVDEQPWLWFDCRGEHDAPVPVYAGYKSDQPWVAAESIGDMVLYLIAGLEAGAYSTDEHGDWNEPNWDIVDADETGIL